MQEETGKSSGSVNGPYGRGHFAQRGQPLLPDLGPVEWSAQTEMLDMGNTENVRKKKR